jgi:hypothetical protein
MISSLVVFLVSVIRSLISGSNFPSNFFNLNDSAFPHLLSFTRLINSSSKRGIISVAVSI